jgi:hypothetical protein
VLQLIRVADERLYRLKHAAHARAVEAAPQPSPAKVAEAPSTEPISISCCRPCGGPSFVRIRKGYNRSCPVSHQPDGSGNKTSGPFAVQRKSERVSMAGTNAYAVVGEKGTRRARVLDFGFGGVALEFDQPEELPENFVAILHVPILPLVRVSLRPVWSRRTNEGRSRFGRHFVSRSA